MKFGIVLLLFAFLFSCHNATTPTSNASSDSLPKLSNKRDSLNSLHIYPDTIDEQNVVKAEISKSDSSFSVFGNIRKDYRIFGYEQPDTNSKRLIVFSVFTRDVDGNPYKCDYGAFYQTSSMENTQIKYKSIVGSFVETELYTSGGKTTNLFFERRWIDFTD